MVNILESFESDSFGLLGLPCLTRCQGFQVDCTISISIDEFARSTWKDIISKIQRSFHLNFFRIFILNLPQFFHSWNTSTVQAKQFNIRSRHIFSQILGIVPKIHSIISTQHVVKHFKIRFSNIHIGSFH